MSDEMSWMCPKCGKTWRAKAPTICQACSSFAAPHGSAQSKTFIAEKSDTKFALTPQEEAQLNNLMAWQEMSAKSTMMIGGKGEAPNEKGQR
jgi:hypothetical protein